MKRKSNALLVFCLGFSLLTGCSIHQNEITYDGNGATSGQTNSTQIKDGTKLTLAQCKFKRKGYSFVCWNDKKDGSGTDYLEGQMFQNAGTVSHKLYAKWMPKKIGLVVQTTDKSLKFDADADYASFDVVIDGKEENSSLYFKTYVKPNMKFKITNIQPEDGYVYKGIHTVTDMNKGLKTVNLVFEKKGESN